MKGFCVILVLVILIANLWKYLLISAIIWVACRLIGVYINNKEKGVSEWQKN